MKTLSVAILAASAALAASAGAKSAELTSRYTKLEGCHLIEEGALGQDWALLKCKGYGDIPIWRVASDSTRGYLGFGAKKNVSGTFGLDRDDAKWPIEWRGQVRGRTFQPLAAIVRMDRPAGAYEGPAPIKLFVFRLRPDGTSCIVGEEVGSNEEARRIADAAAGEFSCLQEPQIL